MKKLKFKYKVIIMAAFLVCVSSVCYGMTAPQLTRSLFVQWSDMQEIAPNVYVNPQMSKEKRQDLLKEMNAAKKRVIEFEKANPNVISTYILSCYEVSHWYDKVGRDGFQRFIEDIADGRGFAETYTRSYK